MADKNYKSFKENEYPVITPKEVINYEYDYVVMAINYQDMRNEAKEDLIRIGVEENKIADVDINIIDARLICGH